MVKSNPTDDAPSAAGGVPEAAVQSSPSQPGYAWDARILGSRVPQTSGYGVGRRTIRGRARTVRAARHPQGSRVPQPLILALAGGVVGVAGWAVMVQAALGFANNDLTIGPGDVERLLVAAAAYLVGVGLFSWAWELGDRTKAVKLGAIIAIAGVAVWLVIAGIAVILASAARGGARRAERGGSTAADAAPQGLDALGLVGQIAVSEARGRLRSAVDRARDAPDDPQSPGTAVYGDRVAPPRGWRGRRSPRKRVE